MNSEQVQSFYFLFAIARTANVTKLHSIISSSESAESHSHIQTKENVKGLIRFEACSDKIVNDKVRKIEAFFSHYIFVRFDIISRKK